MLKKQQIKHLFLLPILCFSFTTKAQVTIGSTDAPNLGAILDLKQNNSSDINATKGLLLPRVDLESETYLYPMLPKNYDKTTEDTNHIGLIVYNSDDCTLEGNGTYVWDGERWIILYKEQNPDLYSFTDQDGNPFLARKFGDAGIWMVQNLSAKNYDTVRDSYDQNIYETISFKSPNNDETLTEAYPWMGLLYNFATATNNLTDINNTQRIQGMCPHGWHVPSSAEWGELENEMIQHTNQYTSLTETYASNGVALQGTPPVTGNNEYGAQFRSAMLSPCTVAGKTDITIEGVSRRDIHGGFAIRMTGAILANGSVDGYGIKGGFWVASLTSTPSEPKTGRNRVYIYNQNFVNNNAGDLGRYYAIRCKKNE